MTPRNHVVITGTGRCGTTFLVELLTHLGLQTGFSTADVVSKKSKEARAGLEYDIREKDCPFIIKNPWFCDYAEEVLSRGDIVIDHIFIPMRDLHATAESRRHVVKANVTNLSFFSRLKHMIKPKKFDGGLWQTNSSKPGKQEEILLRQLYKVMLAISGTMVPVTVMLYPRITQDSQYLFVKLKPILGDISYECFDEIFKNTVRPDLVHSFNKRD